MRLLALELLENELEEGELPLTDDELLEEELELLELELLEELEEEVLLLLLDDEDGLDDELDEEDFANSARISSCRIETASA